jgi:hypothetical protein
MENFVNDSARLPQKLGRLVRGKVLACPPISAVCSGTAVAFAYVFPNRQLQTYLVLKVVLSCFPILT